MISNMGKKKRGLAEATAGEKYVPSFGNSKKQGGHKRKKLNCGSVTTATSVNSPSSSSKDDIIQSDSETRKVTERISGSILSNSQPHTQVSPSIINLPSTRMFASCSQPPTQVSPSHGPAHVFPRSQQPLSKMFQKPQSSQTVALVKQLQTSGDTLTMHLKENITTLTASSSNQELENTPLISLPEVSQPTTSNTLNQDDLHSMSCSPMHPAINSCPRKEHGCNDYEDCDDLVCVGECVGKPVAPDTAAIPIAETVAAEPTGLPEGQTDCKSTEARSDPLTRHEGLQGIIAELSLLNEYVLKHKRELDNARQQYARNRL